MLARQTVLLPIVVLVRLHQLRRSAQLIFGANPKLVEVNGIEPMTSCLQSRRSPN